MKIIYLEDLEKFAKSFAKKVIALIPKNFIISGSQTTTSDQDGGSNVYTFMDAAGHESTFTVKNGSKGSAGATGQRGSRWNTGTSITGTSTTATVFNNSGITDALVNDYYLNTSTGYVYRCTVAGAASAAKWVYVGTLSSSNGNTDTATTATYLENINIQSNANLNDCLLPGNYSAGSDAIAATVKNSPTSKAFNMDVRQINANTATQEITEYMKSGAKKWFRNSYNGSWGRWYRIYTEANRPTPSEIGAISPGDIIYDDELIFEADFSKTRVYPEGFDIIDIEYGEDDDGSEWTDTATTKYRQNYIDAIDWNSYYIKTKDFSLGLGGYWFNGNLYNYVYATKMGMVDLGSSSNKWKQLYATNGTIQTSDRNEKNSEEALPISIIIPFILGLLPKRYKMNSGSSDRFHWGLISQDIEELMQKLGITDLQFAGFIKSPKVRIITEDENGKPLKTPIEEVIEGEYVYSLRYDEFIAPIILFIQELYSENTNSKDRITYLEAENASLKETVQVQKAQIEELQTAKADFENRLESLEQQIGQLINQAS